MASWFHAAILATGIAATVAVGVASAAMLSDANNVAAKGDRLAAPVNDTAYATVEIRSQNGSTLARVRAD